MLTPDADGLPVAQCDADERVGAGGVGHERKAAGDRRAAILTRCPDAGHCRARGAARGVGTPALFELAGRLRGQICGPALTGGEVCQQPDRVGGVAEDGGRG
jgi:hypothetical protein